MELMTERFKVVGCLAPVNVSSGAWVGKPINMTNVEQVTFLVYQGAGDSTGLITVEKGTTSSLGTAIAYNYQVASAGAAAYAELDGALTAATSSGVAVGTLPLDNGICAITINNSELGTSGWVGVKGAASGSATYVAIIALCRVSHPAAIPVTVIA